MVDKNRITISTGIRFCSHAECDVEIETIAIDPPEFFPHSPARINQRTCSHYLLCNLQDKDACVIVLNRNKEAAATKALLD